MLSLHFTSRLILALEGLHECSSAKECVFSTFSNWVFKLPSKQICNSVHEDKCDMFNSRLLISEPNFSEVTAYKLGLHLFFVQSGTLKFQQKGTWNWDVKMGKLKNKS